MSVTLTLPELPSYLRNSLFYRSLGQNQDPFDVPSTYFKVSSDIERSEDLRHLLQTLRFWGVEECPEDLLAYVVTHPSPITRAHLREFAAELNYAATLDAILAQPNTHPLAIAYRGGDLSVVKFLEGRGYECANACQKACEANHLACLKHARQGGHEWIVGMCEVAVERGHIECLQYAIENGCAWKVSAVTAQLESRIWTDNLALTLRMEGHGLCCKDSPCSERHLDCLKYAHDRGHYWGTVILIAAAECGHLSCMKYAHGVGCTWTPDVASTCARHGHLDCLEYCVENGCPLNATWALHRAAEGGHVHCVSILLKHGAHWTTECVLAAVSAGHLDFVAYAVQRGAYLLAAVGLEAAGRGNLPVLKYSVEHGCRINELTYRAAAEAGHWHICDYLLEKSCSRPWSVLWDAVLRGIATL
jgi:hypothetical protein